MDSEALNAPAEHANPELANTLFPPPPAYWKSFTDSNVTRYAELFQPSGEPSGTSKGKAASSASDDELMDYDENGRELSDEERKELAQLSRALEKPRSDWVVEEGRWMCFGAPYSVSRPFTVSATKRSRSNQPYRLIKILDYPSGSITMNPCRPPYHPFSIHSSILYSYLSIL